MRAEGSVRGSWQWLRVVACLAAGTAIGIAGYFSRIPFDIRVWMRAGLSVIFLALLAPARRNTPVRETLLAFFAVSGGLLVAGLFLADVSGRLGIDAADPRGFAVDKIGESLPVVVLILLVVLVSRRRLSSLSLSRGKAGWSLVWGLAVGVLLFAYFLASGGWQVFQPTNFRALLPVMGWVALFSIVNGFTEELWFRGLFQSRLETLLGRRWGFWLTALLFGLLHLFGSFGGTLGTMLLSGVTLLLGIAFGAIVRRTGSLWGAVAGHFFADFFFMLGYFATRG